MLKGKRIGTALAVLTLTVAVQSADGLFFMENTEYQRGMRVSAAEKLTLFEDEDPGRERLSGEGYLPDLEAVTEGAMQAAYGRAISDYSPFMGSTPYFHSDVFADREIVHGIDVSKYQKDIDWKAVKEAGVEYAIIRAGFRGYGKNGGMGADTYFEQNIKGALEAGMEVGVYLFSQATTEEEAIEEANYTLEKIKGYDITLPVVMDFEYATVNGKEGGRLYDANLSKVSATKVCLAFCETVEKAGYEPMLYANASMLKNKLNAEAISSRYKIWLANYTSMTAYEGSYDFWQYSSKGTVNGITGNVDCNFWYREQKNEESSVEQVSNLTVGGRTGNRIRLNWDSLEGVDGYRIYRYDEQEEAYKSIKTLNDGTLSTWVDTAVEAGKAYKYVIKAYIRQEDSIFWSVKSKELTARTRPEVVEDFVVSIERKDKLRLNWKQTLGADGYRIYRYNSKTKTYEKIKTLGAKETITWVDTGLKSNTTYKYKITAYMENAEGKRYSSGYSEAAVGKTKK